MNLPLLALVLAIGDGGSDPSAYNFAPPDDAHELRRGEWVMVEMNDGGIKLPGDALKALGFEFTLKADKVVMRLRDETREGSYRVSAERGAKEIDFRMDGVTAPGIYQLNGDRLRIAVGQKQRPRDFAAGGTGEAVLILERVRK
jgi:uncharacterized protein (TIGR03067 family)